MSDENRLEKSLRERIVWGGLLVALLATVAIAAVSVLKARQNEIERLGPAPEFTFITQRSTPFSREDLDGQVWLADFMFTTCQGICPILTDRMKGFQERFADRDGWKIVSFSVDPAHDRPDTLAAYAAQHGADPARWTFLTGDKQDIFRTITDGFHLVVEEGAGTSVEPTLHSPRIVLIDARGEIRGYYDALDQDSMTRLGADLDRLLKRGGA
jgi:protein SCO1/2